MLLCGRVAERAARRVLELELVAIGLPHDEVLETGGDNSHSDAFRTERCAWSLKQTSHFSRHHHSDKDMLTRLAPESRRLAFFMRNRYKSDVLNVCSGKCHVTFTNCVVDSLELNPTA